MNLPLPTPLQYVPMPIAIPVGMTQLEVILTTMMNINEDRTVEEQAQLNTFTNQENNVNDVD
jgi:hypothetical protein